MRGMVSLPARHRWLLQLTHIPTTSGREHRVKNWVTAWVRRRDDLRIAEDEVGNLLVTVAGRRRRDPVIATAHMDHPGFVVAGIDGRTVRTRFMGGVRPDYFAGAAVELFDSDDVAHPARVIDHDAAASTAVLETSRRAPTLAAGDVGRWRFPSRSLGVSGDRFRAPACDDLAGVAAALAAIDRARSDPALRHFGVLLTRAEEEGFIGAIGACRSGSIPERARLLSIETSRSFPESPIGGGPIVRVGDLSSIFDHDLTDAVTQVARSVGLRHQRKLMAGGSCEATAFGAYGYRATGLCLALGNYHNMADIDGVVAGAAPARLAPEEISLADFDGLITLMLAVAREIDGVGSALVDRLEARFQAGRHLLDPT
jgi:putative aminopeptidase FrvX